MRFARKKDIGLGGGFRDWVNISDTWNNVTKNANDNPTNSYCANSKNLGPGWRLPNQRELGLIYIAGTGGSGLCRTYYSGVPSDHGGAKGTTHTFRANNTAVSLQEKITSTTFRCVKDN